MKESWKESCLLFYDSALAEHPSGRLPDYRYGNEPNHSILSPCRLGWHAARRLRRQFIQRYVRLRTDAWRRLMQQFPDPTF